MPPKRSAADKSKTSDQNSVPLISASALQHNLGVLEYARTCQSAAAAFIFKTNVGIDRIHTFLFNCMSAKEWQRKCEQQEKQMELVEKRLRGNLHYKLIRRHYSSVHLFIPITKEKKLDRSFNDVLQTEIEWMRERLKAAETESKEKTEQLNRAIAQAESDADKFEKLIKHQHDKMVVVKGELERERTGHGESVAAIHNEYANERRKTEELNRKLADAYTKIHEKEQLPESLKKKEKEMKDEICRWKKEAEEWKDKAAKTPTAQLLHDKLSNLKTEHERELAEAKSQAEAKAKTDTLAESRLRSSEDRLQSLASQLAQAEGARVQAEEEGRIAREESAQANVELDRLRSLGLLSSDPLERLKAAVREARIKRPDEDIRDLLGGDSSELAESKGKYERLKEEFERYKLKAEAVLKSKQPKEDSSSSTPSEEEEGLRLLVSQLHNKLRSLEVAHSTDQAQFEQESRNLRQRVCDLERAEENSRTEMRREIASRVSEMESEMTKQRQRTLEVLAEKERELEATRSILVSLRSDQLSVSSPLTGMNPPSSSSAPADPVNEDKRAAKIGKSSHRRSMGSVSSAIEEQPVVQQQIALPIGNESRNIYYEEELSKKEREIGDLRQSLHQLDYRMREMEQNYLCRDLQHHEMTEKLKEELRILEGKLALSQAAETGSSEYLRNIFVQLLGCDSAAGRKHILKAMGTVLKLSHNELKTIEKRSWN
ncbi:gcc-1 [Pristionchus pacificus]|uniref:Gcc-1 n=1 Tax=Pristionchus pacificus TaxID=54126 RepID=A0A2A6D0B8_PRIPA|nr:gcc-1 [Pristionchus pacificus]|eukprot:PDM83818.1 gcc-1 [Pristionchus pacificus]